MQRNDSGLVLVNGDVQKFVFSQGDEWAKVVDVAGLYGQGVKVTLNANFGGDKTSYSTLLEYTL